MGLRWLITGGCGFIGTAFIQQLVLAGGHFIRVVDNLSVGTRADLAGVCDFKEQKDSGKDVELIVGDILDQELALHSADGMDVIVHLAANTGVWPSVENPRNDCMTNVVGTLNYLEAARHGSVKRFVFASSGAPVGEVQPPIHEELAAHPVSPYGASKLAGEGYCSAYYRTFGVETVALRFGNVYGPLSGHKNSVVAKFIRQTICGETLEIYGDGKQTRDFIYIGDLVKAVYLAATVKDIGGEIFQIATSAETTVDELVRELLPILEKHGFKEITVHHGPQRLGDVRRNYSDTTKACKRMGWKPETNLAVGLEKTVSWYLSNNIQTRRQCRMIFNGSE